MKRLYRLSDLSGFALHARDGDIGHLTQVYFDDQGWQVRYLVVRTGGWLLGRDVLLVPAMVEGIDDAARCINVDLTCEQIRNAPPIDEHKPVSRYYEQEYFHHYDWEPYWVDDPLFSGLPVSPPPADETPPEPEDPHLRSSDEVAGYEVHGADGDVGEVVDALLETPGWSLRYIEVRTGGWLVGKNVLIACAWLDGIDWATSHVATSLTRKAIETAPGYDADSVPGREYEQALFDHYGKRYDQDA